MDSFYKLKFCSIEDIFFAFLVAFILFLVLTGHVRIKRLKYQRLGQYAGLLVLSGLNFLIYRSLLVQFLLLDDLKEELILVVVDLEGPWTLFAVNLHGHLIRALLFLINNAKRILSLSLFLLVIGKDLVHNWLVYSFIVDQRVLDLCEHFEPLSLLILRITVYWLRCGAFLATCSLRPFPLLLFQPSIVVLWTLSLGCSSFCHTVRVNLSCL